MTERYDQQILPYNLRCNGTQLKKLTHGGLVWLERNHKIVNQLNVFPVPDGDTGTNMLLTMREAYANIAEIDSVRVDTMSQAISEGALHGSRGNSGTILSQLWAGFAQGMAGHADFDAHHFARACQIAVEAAYRSVTNPVEGTILTVARESMETIVRRVESSGEQDLTTLLKAMVYAAKVALRNTPEQLPVLREANVVDSGGQGLVFILEGMLFALTDQLEDQFISAATVKATVEDMLELQDTQSERYGYDVQFQMHGFNLNVDAIRQAIDEIGWSTVVVGSDRLVKVHVHVHDPSKPLSYAVNMGVELDDVIVENMDGQVRERYAQPPASAGREGGVGVIAVTSGVGLRRLFMDELQAAYIINGGQTMNPSTGDFLQAIETLPHREIVLLPNNKNIILAAQQAAAKTEKAVIVVPSRTIPQGIAALFGYINTDEDSSLEAVTEAMTDGLNTVVSAEITTATRDVSIGGVSVREGQLIGIVEGELSVAGENMLTVMRDLLKKADVDEYELISLYYGNDTHLAKVETLVAALQTDYPDHEFQITYGGQPLYPYIISLE